MNNYANTQHIVAAADLFADEEQLVESPDSRVLYVQLLRAWDRRLNSQMLATYLLAFAREQWRLRSHLKRTRQAKVSELDNTALVNEHLFAGYRACK